MDFSSKNVIITGAARGIGYAISAKLLEKGSKVLLTDIDLNAAKEAKRELEKKYGERVKCVDFSCDVTSPENYTKAFETCEREFGKPNMLVNNAGCVGEKNFRDVMFVNLEAPINGTEIAIKYMGKQEGGQGGNVINMASITGLQKVPFIPFYAATKAGLISYTRNVGHPFNYNRTGVNVQCLCPNAVDTRMLLSATESIARDREGYLAILEFLKPPYLQPEDVASALITLLQDDKPGAVMVVDYGKESYYHEI